MLSMEDFITAVFCCVDDRLKEVINGQPVRSRGFQPSLSDSEVITMEIVAEFQGIDTDKGIWQYFRRHWMSMFPQMKSRSTFVRQAANLWQYKQKLQQLLARELGALSDNTHIIDGIPIPLCCFSRAPGCRSFQGEASYGYCAAKKETYYGFHGHLLISACGVITGFTLTPANGDEREAIWDIVRLIQGMVIGDKGYINATLRQELARYGINLQTALRSNMHDTRPKRWVKLLQTVRRLIETVIGQLSVKRSSAVGNRFNFEKVWARDMWHLTSRLNRKLLAHTVCLWLNRLFALEPLQFDDLVTE